MVEAPFPVGPLADARCIAICTYARRPGPFGVVGSSNVRLLAKRDITLVTVGVVADERQQQLTYAPAMIGKQGPKD